MKEPHSCYLSILLPEDVIGFYKALRKDLKPFVKEIKAEEEAEESDRKPIKIKPFPDIPFYLLGTQTVESINELEALLFAYRADVKRGNITVGGMSISKRSEVYFKTRENSALTRLRALLNSHSPTNMMLNMSIDPCFVLTRLKSVSRFQETLKGSPFVRRKLEKVNWEIPTRSLAIVGKEWSTSSPYKVLAKVTL